MNPPHWTLAVSEAPRALLEFSSLALFRKTLINKLPRGDGHGVMVLPGFMGDDPYNQSLIDFLNELGYVATGWEMGRNLGQKSISVDDLKRKIAQLARSGDGHVSLVGHSLGGIYAREIARKAPDAVRQVISLGSPFGEGRHDGSHASRLYKRLNPESAQTADEAMTQSLLSIAPPVPTSSIYTKADGVVNWRTAIQDDNHTQTQNIEVIGSHCGLTLNPVVWYLLANLLLEKKDSWQRFKSPMFHCH